MFGMFGKMCGDEHLSDFIVIIDVSVFHWQHVEQIQLTEYTSGRMQ